MKCGLYANAFWTFKGHKMRTETIQLYTIGELGEKAKQKAISHFRETHQYFWFDEGMESLKTFTNHFGVSILDYEIGAYCPFHYKTNDTNQNFRGLKLRGFQRDYAPTGYCLDYDVWMTFYDSFKESANAKLAFHEALYAGFKAIRDDMEWQLSDEYLFEHIEANEYEFLADGTFH
jgi:hypothetical protein